MYKVYKVDDEGREAVEEHAEHRKELRKAALEDQSTNEDHGEEPEKRPAVDRAGMQQRLRKLLKTSKSKRIAQNMFSSLRKVCVQVKASGGAAYRARKA